MEILDLLDLSKDFNVIKLDDKYQNDYKIESKNSDLVAFINGKDISFCVSGCYNSGSDLIDIDIEDLGKLNKFCKLIIKQEESK